MLATRVRDGVIKRLIGKWLKAGVMENSQITLSEKGTKQGCVISPILANIYLHHVLDEWFHRDVLPRIKGKAFMMRFADDAVLAFAYREDAERVLEVLPKRFERFSLRLHPEKTKLVDFRQPPYDTTQAYEKPGTFSFLGFEHYWGKSRRNFWVVRQKTEKKRLYKSIRKITDYCKQNRHKPLEVQYHNLSMKIRGHYSYFGITGNYRALMKFYRRCKSIWWKWLSRRNSRKLNRQRFKQILMRHTLPTPRIVHSIYQT